MHSLAVKVDEFLQDAEGLVTLGLARSSSQLSFRVNFVFWMHHLYFIQKRYYYRNRLTRSLNFPKVVLVRALKRPIKKRRKKSKLMKVNRIEFESIFLSSYNIHSPTAELAVQERIAEMQATWQDPTAAWDDHTSGGWEDTNPTTTSVQIETVNSVSDSAPINAEAGGVIKCIAFYPYTVKIDISCWSIALIY